ncbi:MAG: hypothetical protein ABI810_06055 [Sphingomonas bacterium]
MKMAFIIAGLGLAVAGIPVAADAAPRQSINQREATLQWRINEGVRSGALNRNEASRLRTRFANLNRLEYRYRRTGGGLSSWERRDLDRRFDMLSGSIRVQKHDRQTRYRNRHR